MKSIVFYANGTAKNHGCEALTKSTHKLLSNHGISHKYASISIPEEQIYGLDKQVSFIPFTNPIKKNSLEYLLYAVRQKFKYSDQSYYKLLYNQFVAQVSENELYLSIGGDNYSYGYHGWLAYLNKNIHKKGAKTALIGCSILDEINDSDLIADLSRYNFIVARESITYEALKQCGIDSDIYCIPDPAFVLDTAEIELTQPKPNDGYVGLNVSPMVIEREPVKGITFENISTFIDWILKETGLNILLIPHVVTPGNNDLPVLNEIYRKYSDTKRVVCIPDSNAETLKGYISKCRFLITARTHASVASYSLKIPTLVIGYSVKSRGIAKDIFGTSENMVLPIQEFKHKESMLTAFRYLLDNESNIKLQLEAKMLEYIQRVYQLPEIISKYL